MAPNPAITLGLSSFPRFPTKGGKVVLWSNQYKGGLIVILLAIVWHKAHAPLHTMITLTGAHLRISTLPFSWL